MVPIWSTTGVWKQIKAGFLLSCCRMKLPRSARHCHKETEQIRVRPHVFLYTKFVPKPSLKITNKLRELITGIKNLLRNLSIYIFHLALALLNLVLHGQRLWSVARIHKIRCEIFTRAQKILSLI